MMNEEIIKDIKKTRVLPETGQKKRLKAVEARKRARRTRAVRGTVIQIRSGLARASGHLFHCTLASTGGVRARRVLR